MLNIHLIIVEKQFREFKEPNLDADGKVAPKSDN